MASQQPPLDAAFIVDTATSSDFLEWAAARLDREINVFRSVPPPSGLDFMTYTSLLDAMRDCRLHEFETGTIEVKRYSFIKHVQFLLVLQLFDYSTMIKVIHGRLDEQLEDQVRLKDIRELSKAGWTYWLKEVAESTARAIMESRLRNQVMYEELMCEYWEFGEMVRRHMITIISREAANEALNDQL